MHFTSVRLNQLVLVYFLALCFGKGICLWRRVNTLCFIHQTFDRENLDFGISFRVIQKICFVTTRISGFFTHMI